MVVGTIFPHVIIFPPIILEKRVFGVLWMSRFISKILFDFFNFSIECCMEKRLMMKPIFYAYQFRKITFLWITTTFFCQCTYILWPRNLWSRLYFQTGRNSLILPSFVEWYDHVNRKIRIHRSGHYSEEKCSSILTFFMITF